MSQHRFRRLFHVSSHPPSVRQRLSARSLPQACEDRIRAGAQLRAPGTAALCICLILALNSAASASPAAKSVSIPHIQVAPTLEDFLDMKPSPAIEGKMAKVEGFIQQNPKDGAPASEPTVVYVGYTDQRIYIVFVAFDSRPDLVRARMTRRENIYDDDRVQVMFDSFHDQRRAYSFVCNPLGIQLDQLFSEDSGSDDSFDMVWDSQGKLTSKGYVVLMAIPFRNLRFPKSGRTWGLIFQRNIPRMNESSYWPRISSSINGLLNQEGTMEGLDIRSVSHNIQLTPYGVSRSYRALDDRNTSHPLFDDKVVGARVGLESKFVVKDRLIFDIAANPDFSQVESDQPQITVDQRFPVFFPEKRQLFLENASFFNTPINLLYTRNIADPLVVTRVTGKLGRYAVGALFADDRSPGEIVANNDPLFGKRAYFVLFRVNRDVGNGSSVGVIYADREFQGGFNRVGGVDFRWKFGKNWDANAQALASSTRTINDSGAGQPLSYSYSAGPAYQVNVERASRKLYFSSGFADTSVGFITQTGFYQRPDIRQVSNFIRYQFRPEGKHLIAHGPAMFEQSFWSHSGTRLEHFVNVNYQFNFQRQTGFGAFVNVERERLRPSDYSALTADRDYPIHHHGIFLNTAFFPWLTAYGEAGWGTETNYVPAVGPPISAAENYFNGGFTVHAGSRLQIDNTYLLSRLRSGSTTASIFNNDIMRSKWNYQINRNFSFRFIGQYTSTLANPQFTSLQTTKALNFDFLFAYLPHPGTEVYLGYNTDQQNLDPALAVDPNMNILRTRSLATTDGRQFFVKVSYQFRF
jgi:hypothetical protein